MPQILTLSFMTDSFQEFPERRAGRRRFHEMFSDQRRPDSAGEELEEIGGLSDSALADERDSFHRRKMGRHGHRAAQVDFERPKIPVVDADQRSEEHTSELQSH